MKSYSAAETTIGYVITCDCNVEHAAMLIKGSKSPSSLAHDHQAISSHSLSVQRIYLTSRKYFRQIHTECNNLLTAVNDGRRICV